MNNIRQIKSTINDKLFAIQNIISTNPHYTIRVSPNYDNLYFSIQHTTAQWTEFAKCTIDKKGLNISHSAGGWNKGKDNNTTSQIFITKEIFDILDNVNQKYQDIYKIFIEISKLSTEVDSIIRKEQEKSILEALNTAKKAISLTHEPISKPSELIEVLNTGGSLLVVQILVNHNAEVSINKIEIENRGSTRKNFYFDGESVSEKYLINILTHEAYYLENTKKIKDKNDRISNF
jgi:hypothetical protein